MLNFKHENSINHPFVIGIDEAGCGPWAGPVVAGAVHFTQHDYDKMPWLAELNDSKKLPEKKREFLFETITSCPYIKSGVGFVSASDIDKIGLSLAISKAIEIAISHINNHEVMHLLVDGIRKPRLNYPMTMLVKGDQKSLSIAAASILAKVSRDRHMKKLHEKFPIYKWANNAGYGTKQHQDAIAHAGICEEHRKSYKPIQRYMEIAI